MRVPTYQLDGSTGTVIDLDRDHYMICWVDGQEVLAISIWGSFVALTLINRLVFVRIADYERLVGYCRSWGRIHE